MFCLNHLLDSIFYPGPLAHTEPLAFLFSGLSNPLVSFHTKINMGPTDVAKILYEDCLT